jgi:hypothetical protein
MRRPGAERLLHQRGGHEVIQSLSSTAPVLELATPVRRSFTLW